MLRDGPDACVLHEYHLISSTFEAYSNRLLQHGFHLVFLFLFLPLSKRLLAFIGHFR
jgi:hypothetical protein